MSDPLIQAVVKPVVEQAVSSGSTPPIGEAKSGDVARFQEAMANGGQPEKVSGTESMEPPVEDLQKIDPAAQLPPSPRESLGESILNGMGKLRSSQETHAQKINELVAGAKDTPMTVQQTMELQFHLLQLNMHQDLTTKVADKGSQGVQNLMKNQ